MNCIDFLRGTASLGVVVFHTSHAISQGTEHAVIAWLYELSCYGAYGVPLFFVISGFCIHRNQAERSAAGLDDSVSFRKYWKRRFVRLYPAYFTVCVASALLMAAAIASGTETSLLSNYPGDPYLYLALDFLTHILLIHSFFPIFDGGLGNGSLWTLAREEQYYLLYFPLLKFRKYAGVFGCLIMSMVVSYAVIRISKSVPADNPALKYVIETSSLAYWPQWVLGMVCMEWLVSRIGLPGISGIRLAIPAGLALVVWQKEYPGPLWTSILMLGLGFFLIVMSLSKIETDARWPRSKAVRTMERIGRYSYSMYLVNYPLAVIHGRLARAMGSNESLIMYLAFLSSGVAVCNLAGYALYVLVERHGQRKPAESKAP